MAPDYDPRRDRPMRAVLAAAAASAALLGAPATAAAQFEGPPVVPGTKSVLFVANNRDGTADIVDPQTFAKLGRLNVIPDLQERLAEKALDPRKLGYFVAVRALIGEGNDQYADDMFSSHDQLSIQYTGAEGRRIRGESLSKAVAR
jgi:hypothetical protein